MSPDDHVNDGVGDDSTHNMTCDSTHDSTHDSTGPSRSHPEGVDRPVAGGRGPRGSFERVVTLTLAQAAASAPAPVLADRLAGAAAGLVGMDAGSVCVLFAPQMSVPVGVSDPFAEMAERVQFTTGEGPCWAAYQTGAGMLIDDVGAGREPPTAAAGPGPVGTGPMRGAGSAAARQWPTYAAAITRSTAFRGVVSFPLRLGLGVPVVLNLYSREPLPALVSDGAALAVVAEGVRAVLDAAPRPGDQNAGESAGEGAAEGAGVGRDWLDSSSTGRRAQVWVAEAVLVQHAPHLDGVAALAAMRTFCALEGGTVDEVAAAVVARQLDPARVLGLR